MKIKFYKDVFGYELYDTKYSWTFHCQSGKCYGEPERYYFEAFPPTNDFYIRAEAETLEDAEEKSWQKYQLQVVCEHEFSRNGRDDEYGVCIKCSIGKKVYEPLFYECFVEGCTTKTRFLQGLRQIPANNSRGHSYENVGYCCTNCWKTQDFNLFTGYHMLGQNAEMFISTTEEAALKYEEKYKSSKME